MHGLADMRIIEGSWAMDACVYEIDANGQATTVVSEMVAKGFSPRGAPVIPPMYFCSACNQEFHSWEEAKLHIADLDQ